jgi:hypothetical protein
MHNHKTNGLILDARMNDGGQPQYYNNGLRHLFNKDLYFLDAVRRSDPNDHLGFSAANSNWPGSYEYLGFKATPEIYDKPIAILAGPSAISAADFYILTARKHPYAKTFGKTTNGAFSGVDGSVDNFSLGSDWHVFYPNHAFYLLENPGEFLAHFNQGVDEDVWLEPDDVARGEDTVVKRAIKWIQNKVYPHSAGTDTTFYVPGSKGTNFVFVENPNDHEISVMSYLFTIEDALIDSFEMTVRDSNMYVSEFVISDSAGEYYFNYKTIDLENGDIQLLPFASSLTSIHTVSVDKLDPEFPLVFQLSQNYPNPFNPITMINYQLPMNCDVELSVYNLLGQKVATLVNKNQPAGHYTVKWDATGIASGVYVYQLKTDTGFKESHKLILMR